MATISGLNEKISSAKKDISTYNEYIKEADLEISNCDELNKVLDELINNASNCSLKLANVYSSLSAGISAKGITEKISKVNEKSKFFSTLSTNAETAKGNVGYRIDELEMDIEDWKSKIKTLNSSISGWEQEKTKISTKIHSFVTGENGGEENG